jgi:hypothetical protein
MDYTRGAVVCIRLLVAALGGFYALMKLIKPELSPLFFLNAEAQANVTYLPYNTNPVFAKSMLVFSMLISIYIITRTIYLWVHETRRYGDALPSTTRGLQAALIVQATFYTYYLILALVLGIDEHWYVGALALISWIIAGYEVKQSNDYDVI